MQFRIVHAVKDHPATTLSFEPHLFAIAQGVFQTLCSRDDTAGCSLLICDGDAIVLLCDQEEWRTAARAMRQNNGGQSPVIFPPSR